MARLLQSLYDEHRAIAAVLAAMESLIRDHRQRGAKVDPKVFQAMLYYLDVFPERLHHPKEESLLFARLRSRTSEGAEVLDELAREHATGEASIRALEQALVRYEAGGEAEFAPFAEAAERFIAGYRDHIRREEHDVMPLAERVFTREDWAEIEAAFAANENPLAGAEHDYDQLFQRIVMLAPAPIGLGPAAG